MTASPAVNTGVETDTIVQLEHVRKDFGDPEAGGYTVFRDATMRIRRGEFVVLVGPSGCGKSTILNMVAGLTEPTAGTVSVFGKPLRGINPHASYMFQSDPLLPWKTVLDNVALGLTFHGTSWSDARVQALKWLKKVRLEDTADKYPSQLSGGMRRRVAMAQCWVINPDILLMDEPFSALDVHTREAMEEELLDIWSEAGQSVLFVTHDLEEAISLADRIIVLSAGPGTRTVGEYLVDLPRPRNIMDIRTEPGFQELYHAIWRDLRVEVLRSREVNDDIGGAVSNG